MLSTHYKINLIIEQNKEIIEQNKEIIKQNNIITTHVKPTPHYGLG